MKHPPTHTRHDRPERERLRAKYMRERERESKGARWKEDRGWRNERAEEKKDLPPKFSR